MRFWSSILKSTNKKHTKKNNRTDCSKRKWNRKWNRSVLISTVWSESEREECESSVWYLFILNCLIELFFLFVSVLFLFFFFVNYSKLKAKKEKQYKSKFGKKVYSTTKTLKFRSAHSLRQKQRHKKCVRRPRGNALNTHITLIMTIIHGTSESIAFQYVFNYRYVFVA